MFKFENGVRVRDAITNFEGMVTSRANYITGNNRIMVTSEKLNGDGEPVDEWFDEDRLAEVPGAARLVF